MKKILLALGFAASMSAGIAKAASCATGKTNTGNAYSNGTSTAVSTACLTLSCTASISALTTKFELVYDGLGAGAGTPGAHYANDPASISDANQTSSFHLDSTCPVTVSAAYDSAGFTQVVTTGTGAMMSTIPVVGIDFAGTPALVITDQAHSQDHLIFASVDLPPSLAGLPAGEYDDNITLTVTTP